MWQLYVIMKRGKAEKAYSGLFMSENHQAVLRESNIYREGEASLATREPVNHQPRRRF